MWPRWFHDGEHESLKILGLDPSAHIRLWKSSFPQCDRRRVLISTAIVTLTALLRKLDFIEIAACSSLLRFFSIEIYSSKTKEIHSCTLHLIR